MEESDSFSSLKVSSERQREKRQGREGEEGGDWQGRTERKKERKKEVSVSHLSRCPASGELGLDGSSDLTSSVGWQLSKLLCSLRRLKKNKA